MKRFFSPFSRRYYFTAALFVWEPLGRRCFMFSEYVSLVRSKLCAVESLL